MTSTSRCADATLAAETRNPSMRSCRACVTERNATHQLGHPRVRVPRVPLGPLGDAPISCRHTLPSRVTCLSVGPGGPDGLDLHAHQSGPFLEPCSGQFPMAMGDEPPNEALVLPQRVAQSHDLLHEAGSVRDRHHDRPVTTFDSLRQRDFYVARQEGNPAHVGEIQPHDVDADLPTLAEQVVKHR